MHGAALRHGVDEHLVPGQLVTRNGLADADDVLVDDAPSPDVEVPDLRVPHLSAGQSDRASRRVERGPGLIAEELIEARFVGLRDGVEFGLLTAAEAVENDEDEEGAGGRGHSRPKISERSD